MNEMITEPNRNKLYPSPGSILIDGDGQSWEVTSLDEPHDFLVAMKRRAQ